MNKRSGNPCIRCGTERIVLKTWKEKVGISYVTNIETICPNSECQKEVDSDNKKQRDKQIAMRLKREQRMTERRVERSQIRL